MSQVEARISERATTFLSATVKFKENKDDFWKETTQTISISRNGAGFFLQRRCQVGQLLSLIIPLPRHLRCYDDDKELYRIWGLVQHCNQVITDEAASYHVGVAFIGKNAPSGYKENPAQSYKIYGMDDDGLWKIAPTAKPFVNRKNPRFWTSLDVTLELLDAEGDDFTREKTITENISVCGAAVYSNLDIEVDDCLHFTSREHDFSGLAVVRYKQKEEDERPKVHLEFVNAKFPVEKIILPIEDEHKN